MTLTDRLSLGLGLILRGEKSLSFTVAPWQNGQAVYPDYSMENAVRFGYKKNEIIYACITLKADSAAAPKLLVRETSTGKEIPDHPLRNLIKSPNPFSTEFDFFSSILTYLDLSGRAYYEKRRNAQGKVIQLWPLRPDYLRPIPDSKTFMAGYLYSPPGLPPQRVAINDVLDFKLFDPTNFYQGMAPVRVASRVGDVDNAATDFIKLFFQKGGMPPGLLKSKQKLIDSQVEEIRRRWRDRYGGFENWLDPAVLDSDAEFQRIGMTFDEMGFRDLDARNEARICMTLRVPPIMVGATVGLRHGTYSNYEQARKAFWEDTLAPQYKRISDTLNQDLIPEFGTGIQLQWDFSAVPALTDDINARWKRAAEAFKVGALTQNQFYDEIGYDRIKDGNVYVRPSNSIEVPEDQIRPIMVFQPGQPSTPQRKPSTVTPESETTPQPVDTQPAPEILGDTE